LRKSSLGRTRITGADILEVAKAWQKKKADAGWPACTGRRIMAAAAPRRSSA